MNKYQRPYTKTKTKKSTFKKKKRFDELFQNSKHRTQSGNQENASSPTQNPCGPFVSHHFRNQTLINPPLVTVLQLLLYKKGNETLSTRRISALFFS